MHFSLSFLMFTCLAGARPTTIKARGVYSSTGASTVELASAVQQSWYTPLDSTGKSYNAPPANPSGYYSCTGPHLADFPTSGQWLSYDDMWTINVNEITKANNGDGYNAMLKQSIINVSYESKVDARLILALIMQESTGMVAVQCTNFNQDCGLLQIRGGQSFDGSFPEASIRNMISEGIYGHSGTAQQPYGWPGYLTYFNALQSDVAWLGSDSYWRGNPYAAAHIYNVGGIWSDDMTLGYGGKNYYANDIASRLLGWDGRADGCMASRQCAELGFQDRAC